MRKSKIRATAVLLIWTGAILIGLSARAEAEARALAACTLTLAK